MVLPLASAISDQRSGTVCSSPDPSLRRAGWRIRAYASYPLGTTKPTQLGCSVSDVRHASSQSVFATSISIRKGGGGGGQRGSTLRSVPPTPGCPDTNSDSETSYGLSRRALDR